MGQTWQAVLSSEAVTPLSGQLVIRDLVLPELLGEATTELTYWAGRALARKLPVAESDLATTMAQLGFGALSLKADKGASRDYLLSGQVVAARLALDAQADFRLEAGFLAQSLQQALNVPCEAAVMAAKRDQVKLQVSIDA